MAVVRGAMPVTAPRRRVSGKSVKRRVVILYIPRMARERKRPLTGRAARQNSECSAVQRTMLRVLVVMLVMSVKTPRGRDGSRIML